MNKKEIIKIVVIGGGTGTSMLLRGLKDYPVKLSAIITTSDSGGSSGRLREEIGMVPPGDVRQCFVALNDEKHPILAQFNNRFSKGSLRGHTFGNIFLALLWQNYGSFQKAIEEAEKMFDSSHSIITVTLNPTNLTAHLNNGEKIHGEANIIKINKLNKKLKKLVISPKENISPKARRAILGADYIIIGPGNLFASLAPPLLIKGVGQALLKSKAKKIYVTNLMNQKKLTYGFNSQDYINYLASIIGEDIFDKVVYHKRKIKSSLIRRYGVEDQPIEIAVDGDRFVGANLLEAGAYREDPNDSINRTLIRHDSKKLAKVIWSIVTNDK